MYVRLILLYVLSRIHPRRRLYGAGNINEGGDEFSFFLSFTAFVWVNAASNFGVAYVPYRLRIWKWNVLFCYKFKTIFYFRMSNDFIIWFKILTIFFFMIHISYLRISTVFFYDFASSELELLLRTQRSSNW